MRLRWLVLCLLTAGFIDAQPLTWFRFDLPPTYEVRGPLEGQGQLDGVLRFLRERLPEYQHAIKTANVPRILAELKQGAAVASAGFLRTPEREAFLTFSIPVMAAPAPVLVVRTAEVHRYAPYREPDGLVDVGKLLDSKAVGLTLTSGRSYGVLIDTVLREHATSRHLYPRTNGQDLGSAPLAMVAAGRLDAALSYPGEFAAFQPLAGALTALTVKGAALLNPVYIVAPQNEAGHRLIARVNDLLVRFWQDPELWTTAEHGLSDSGKLDVRLFIAAGPVLTMPSPR